MQPTVAKMQEDIMLAKEESVQFELEIKQIQENIEKSEKSAHVSQEEEASLRAELNNLEVLFAHQAKQNVLTMNLKEEKKSLVAFDKELSALEKSCNVKQQQLEDSKLEAKRLNNELSELKANADSIKKHLCQLEEKNPWIQDQVKYQ